MINFTETNSKNSVCKRRCFSYLTFPTSPTRRFVTINLKEETLSTKVFVSANQIKKMVVWLYLHSNSVSTFVFLSFFVSAMIRLALAAIFNWGDSIEIIWFNWNHHRFRFIWIGNSLSLFLTWMQIFEEVSLFRLTENQNIVLNVF